MGLGNQASSTTDHLYLLPTHHSERSKYNEGRAANEVANRGCRSNLKHALTGKSPRLSSWARDRNRIIGKYVGNTYNLLKIQKEDGRRGRMVLGITKQIVLEGSEMGKLAWAWGSSVHASNWILFQIKFAGHWVWTHNLQISVLKGCPPCHATLTSRRIEGLVTTPEHRRPSE